MHEVFTPKEQKIIDKLNTPEKVQEYMIKEIKYNWEKDGETIKSFRRVLREKNAHCLEGALFTAAILSQHNYQPLIVSFETREIAHNIFVYKKDGKWGSVGQSRMETLKSRPKKFKDIKSLVMSYYPYYWNYYSNYKAKDTDYTMRGYAKINLNIFKEDWITNEKDLLFIENYLWNTKYRRLFRRHDQSKFYTVDKKDNIMDV